MERSRSPSSGHTQHITQHTPHLPQLNASFTGDSTAAHDSYNPLTTQPFSGAYTDPSFSQDYLQQAKWPLDPSFNNYSQQEQTAQQQALSSQTLGNINSAYLQNSGLESQGYTGHSAQGGNQFPLNALDNSMGLGQDTSAFPNFDFNQPEYDLNRASFDGSASLDPQLLSGLDTTTTDPLSVHALENGLGVSQAQMTATMQSHTPMTANLFPEMVRQQSASPSPHATPGFQQHGFAPMGRSRNTSESLDPSSAMFPPITNEWPSRAFGGHRRQPSDNISELSSHSNQASPYLSTLGDSFDQNPNTPPMLHQSQEPMFNGELLQGFSISEAQMQQPYISPNHSQFPSPQLQAQQLPAFTADNNYGLSTATLNGQFTQQANGLEMFPSGAHDAFPALNNHTSPGEGAADQMSPPEINIVHAPTIKDSTENLRKDGAEHTLSPPLLSNRKRAKSDSHAGSRPSSPFVPNRTRSPSLQPQMSDPSELLAPINDRVTSRSPSPSSRSRKGSQGAHGSRSSSHASIQRDYILDLADPERTPSNGPEGNRAQRHPATFQCHLCPKRFTRAYNLRSHLRTHTDERPFVCTVCGKAFARQHDRKRHEGLHSGEKKFMCRGSLQSAQQWGCGRKFARADALGRHFRSEAGRVCIKPLLDEEAAERQRAWLEAQQQSEMASDFTASQSMLNAPLMDPNNFLPQALLAQYPALAGIDWSNVPQGNTLDDEYSGRSSFDAGASSGGEYYDDLSENELAYQDPAMAAGINNINSMNTMNNMNGLVGMNQQHMGLQQGSQAVRQPFGIFPNQTSDYLSDFEGR
ncbi:hypothetical protein LTR62_007392 [Meristemomyces frigidus]|uniref:C2H2-type domain-containing protein n=1 Tax=Meristemomyces frigidus TaxID=1508187 RepID=A0AAN7YIX1_9PEZI|nr:hypothetical protein LTR62_007392 [Meristemomyces frigidus]